MKGIISVVELIIVAVILFTTFQIFFPGGTVTNRWQEADTVVKSRDMMIAMDKAGDFYKNSFSSDGVSNFIKSVLPGLNLFSWTETGGAIKNRITVACDCTDAQITDLINWASNNKINGRTITFDFVPADFNNIPKSDVLIIFGYKDITPYKQNLKNYLDGGSGIVEIADLDSSSKVDSIQQEIFGLKWIESASGNLADAKFSRKPVDSKDAIYTPYKYFYHLPLNLIGSFSDQLQGCSSTTYKGNLNVKQTDYAFWICSPTTVWFDANKDGQCCDGDSLASVGNTITLDGSTFFLNYVSISTIGLSFRPDYVFQDFLTMGNNQFFHIEPEDLNNVVIYSETNSGKKYPAAIVNNTGGSVAWIADFKDSGVGDDEKVLLTSILFRSSNKQSQSITGNIKVGYSSSYLNVNNTDTFEVYRFNLGLGFPF